MKNAMSLGFLAMAFVACGGGSAVSTDPPCPDAAPHQLDAPMGDASVDDRVTTDAPNDRMQDDGPVDSEPLAPTFDVHYDEVMRREYSGGGEMWRYANGFRLATPEALWVGRVVVAIEGNTQCIASVGIGGYAASEPMAWSLVSRGSVLVEVDMTLAPKVVTPTDGGHIIFVRLNPVTSDPSGCYSGSEVRLRIASNFTAGRWGSAYEGRYNIQAAGIDSLRQFFSSAGITTTVSSIVVR